jgi:hypothetical protein
MTRYLLFFLTGFAHALVISVYWGLKAEASSFYPVLGLAGAIPLFAVASWLTLFSMRAGALLALLAALLLLFWNAAAAQQILQATTFDSILIILHIVLAVLALSAVITSARYTFRTGLSWHAGTPKPGNVLKVVLAVIPVAVVVAYLLYA